MQIFLIIKCGLVDSYNFITQISGIRAVDRVIVFRDTPSLPAKKVEYKVARFKKITFIKLAHRLLQIYDERYSKPNLIVGIYEIPHGLLAMLAGKILKVPSVVSIIGNPAYAKLRKGFRLKVTMWILNKCDFVTVTGVKSKKFLIEQGITPKKLFILPNTLDFKPFKPIACSKEYDIASLGRISEEKHVEIIVRLVAELKKTIPTVRSAIAGDGPKKKMIVDLIRELDLQENIDIKGFIPNEDLAQFLNKGKVFVLTSETEGFPRTIVQAAACGIPVVASAVGDVPEIIDHNVDGFLVENYRNVGEYSKRIIQLLTDKELYERFSVNLNTKVRKQFVTENASNVWHEILLKAGAKC